MKQKLTNWVPMAFCVSLSFISVIAFISSSSGSWVIPFLCFLPMCFFFEAATTSKLQREVRELREQVAKLQEKQVTSHTRAG